MKIFWVMITLSILNYSESIAQVINSSYTTQYGERVLQLSITIPMGKKEVWKLFTTDEGLIKWIAPVVKIDMRTGGSIRTNYDMNKTFDDSTSIRLDIINYLEYELLTLKINLNNSFPEEARKDDKNLQEILQFIEIDTVKTKIVFSMIGWGQGTHWDKTYSFFEKGNVWTVKEILNLFE